MADDSNQNPFQTLVRWAIILFFAYLMFTNSGRIVNHAPQPQQTATATPQATASAKEDDCGKKSLFPFSVIPFSPVVPNLTRTKELAIGTGPAAVCGQTAKITYDYTTSDKGKETTQKGTASLT